MAMAPETWKSRDRRRRTLRMLGTRSALHHPTLSSVVKRHGTFGNGTKSRGLAAARRGGRRAGGSRLRALPKLTALLPRGLPLCARRRLRNEGRASCMGVLATGNRGYNSPAARSGTPYSCWRSVTVTFSREGIESVRGDLLTKLRATRFFLGRLRMGADMGAILGGALRVSEINRKPVSSKPLALALSGGRGIGLWLVLAPLAVSFALALAGFRTLALPGSLPGSMCRWFCGNILLEPLQAAFVGLLPFLVALVFPFGEDGSVKDKQARGPVPNVLGIDVSLATLVEEHKLCV